MSEPTDRMLLRSFIADKSEAAFRQLVTRYVNMVHGSALRQVRNWSAAEDVTQAVFIVLWNKAHTLRDAAALPAWLLSVTRLTARDAIKRQMTRNRHEHEAGAMITPTPSVDFNALAANLDEALNALSTADRSAVALRYLSAQSYQEVAAALGVSEEAAKKRVSRALERLRHCLSKRGLTSPADLLEKSLTSIAILPPTAGMVEGIMAACHGAAASASVVGLSKAAEGVLMASKIKMAALAATAIVAALAGGVVVSVKIWNATSPSDAILPILPVSAAAPGPVAPYTGPYALQFANGYQIKVIGVCRDPRNSKLWWGPDGVPLNVSPLSEPLDFHVIDQTAATQHPPDYKTTNEYAVVFQVPTPPLEPWGGGGGYGMVFSPRPLFAGGFHFQPWGSTKNLREMKLIHMFYLAGDPKTVSAGVTATVGPWENLAGFDHNLHRLRGNTDIHLEAQPNAANPGNVLLTIGDPSLIAENYAYDFVGVRRNSGNSWEMFQPWQENPSSFSLGNSVDEYQLYRSPQMTGTIPNISLQPVRSTTPAAVAKNEVYVAGAMQRTGVYSIDPTHLRTLHQLVNAAGIDVKDIDKGEITLIRKTSATTETTTKYSLKDVMQTKVGSLPLQPFDIIDVTEQP